MTQASISDFGGTLFYGQSRLGSQLTYFNPRAGRRLTLSVLGLR
jgi:hypothetical protein